MKPHPLISVLFIYAGVILLLNFVLRLVVRSKRLHCRIGYLGFFSLGSIKIQKEGVSSLSIGSIELSVNWYQLFNHTGARATIVISNVYLNLLGGNNEKDTALATDKNDKSKELQLKIPVVLQLLLRFLPDRILLKNIFITGTNPMSNHALNIREFIIDRRIRQGKCYVDASVLEGRTTMNNSEPERLFDVISSKTSFTLNGPDVGKVKTFINFETIMLSETLIGMFHNRNRKTSAPRKESSPKDKSGNLKKILAIIHIVSIKIQNLEVFYKPFYMKNSNFIIQSRSIRKFEEGLYHQMAGDEFCYELIIAFNAFQISLFGENLVYIPMLSVSVHSDLIGSILDQSSSLSNYSLMSTTNINSPCFTLNSQQLHYLLEKKQEFQLSKSPKTESSKTTDDPVKESLIDKVKKYRLKILITDFILKLSVNNDSAIVVKDSLISTVIESAKNRQESRITPVPPKTYSYLLHSGNKKIFQASGLDVTYESLGKASNLFAIASIEVTTDANITDITAHVNDFDLDVSDFSFFSIVSSFVEEYEKFKITKVSTSSISNPDRINKRIERNFHLIINGILLTFGAAKILPDRQDDGVNLSDSFRGFQLTSSTFTLDMNTSNPQKDLKLENARLYYVAEHPKNPKELFHDLAMTTALTTATITPEEISCSSELVELKISLQVIWCIFFCNYLIKQMMIRKPQKADELPDSKKSSVTTSNKKKALKLDINHIIALFSLPNELNLLVELDAFKVNTANSTVTEFIPRTMEEDEPLSFISFKYVRIFTRSQNVSNHWVKLIILKQLQIIAYLSIENKKAFHIATSGFKLTIQHQFRFYKVLDNVVTSFKSIKQIKNDFRDVNNFSQLVPVPETPKAPPRITFKTEEFIFNIEDDPFEQELGIIYRVGRQEQMVRLHKLKLFEQKCKEMEDEKVLRSRIPSPFGTRTPSPFSQHSYGPASLPKKISKVIGAHKHANSETTLPDIEEVSELPKQRASTKSQYEDELYKLRENFSTSWIHRVKAAQKHHEGHSASWDTVDPILLKKHRILEDNPGNSLFKIHSTKFVLDLDVPSFGKQNYAEFHYKFAKKIPLDTDYTLLILMHASLKTELFRFSIRDYPLPILQFPNMKFYGDLSISEKLENYESNRQVFVPFVRSCTSGDSIYGSHIIRTLNPVKLTLNMNSDIDSKKPTIISWGKSLQPAIQAVMLCFDYFTKPPIDKSEKIGFWDKIRLMVHGRLKYNWKNNSELRLNFKGESDPYNIVGSGNGLTFCWSENAVLDIHGTKDPKELIVITSEKFLLIVPDLLTDGAPPQKVALRLSGEVKWTLGLLFERGEEIGIGMKPRSTEFDPHYSVALKYPNYVEDDHDSYRGFRSNFIHLAINVCSVNANSGANSCYLSPYFFSHFFAWWHLFGSVPSLPIRKGVLWNNENEKTKKFGAHLFTIKYQIQLAPLSISHIYRFTDSDIDLHSKVTFTGIKCKVGSFLMDLHQRREPLVYTNHELHYCKRIWKLKMYQGELDFKDADIRLISVVFNEDSTDQAFAKQLGIYEGGDGTTINESIQSPTTHETMSAFGAFRESRTTWFDYEDFTELEQPKLKTSAPLKFKTIPFITSPRISYFRQCDHGNAAVKFNFGYEPSHTCVIGENHPEKTQEHLAKMREEEIEEQIKTIETSVQSLNDDPNSKSAAVKKRLSELNRYDHSLKHRLHVIRCILDDLEFSKEPSSSFESDDEESELSFDEELRNDDLRAMSGLSLTKTVTSFREMRDQSLPNADNSFENRFIIHNMKLHVNASVRDTLVSYLRKVEDRKALVYYMGRKAAKLVEELSEAKTTEYHYDNDINVQYDSKLGEVKCEVDFDEELRKVDETLEEFRDSYFFKLISPQIQVSSHPNPDDCVLIAARDMELKVIAINESGQNDQTSDDKITRLIEDRYGIHLREAHFFCLSRGELTEDQMFGFKNNASGADGITQTWPPWLAMEMCYDSACLANKAFVEKTSGFFRLTKPNNFYFIDDNKVDTHFENHNRHKEVRVDLPKIVATCDSDQFNKIHDLAVDILTFDDSKRTRKIEKLEKVLIASDIRNSSTSDLDLRVKTLQTDMRELRRTKLYLMSKNYKLYEQNIVPISVELQKLCLELVFLMRAIQTNNARLKSKKENVGMKDTSFHWEIGADEIILHLLDGVRVPMVDVALAHAKFTRVETAVGANSNRICIGLLQSFNFQKDARYPELLSPYVKEGLKAEQPFCDVEWDMLEPIGGISIMKRFEINLKPVKLQLDHKSAKRLHTYLFPPQQTDVVKPASVTHDEASAVDDVLSLNSEKSAAASTESSNILQRRFSKRRDTDSVHSATAEKKRAIPLKISTKKHKDEEDDLIQMVGRSSKFVSIMEGHIHSVLICISYKGSHALDVIDVQDFEFTLPSLDYSDITWSFEDFVNRIKKDLMKVLLSHSGSFIGNKFKHHHKAKVTEPLKQISSYVHFTSIQELTNGKGDEQQHHQHHHHPHHHHVDSPIGDQTAAKSLREDEIFENSDDVNEDEIEPFYQENTTLPKIRID